MNEIVNTFLLAWDKFMLEMHLRQPGFTLRSYEIINKSYFCVRHKNSPKHNQHFKTAVFHNKFALCHITSTIYI